MKEREFSPIAVVGMSALFPGAKDAADYWRRIIRGSDLITDVPEGHWLVEDYYSADKNAPEKTYGRRGGFLSAVDFDPMEFRMPPNVLSSTDTSQLLALIAAKRVLQDTVSFQTGAVARDDTSVILGVASATELVAQMSAKIQAPVWTKVMREAGLPESQVQTICRNISDSYQDWTENTFPGLLGNVVAGRIANKFNLGGTNCVVDAACASSLAAVSMAIQDLQLGRSDLAITGGVDAINDIFMYMCFSKTPALSETGDCRPFAENADGTLLGEGVGLLALRRFEDAERDGDKIYAVIQGMGASSDGEAKTVYAPNPLGQAKAIQRAYGFLDGDLSQVDLIEAHGTATRAGDVAEFAGLCKAFENAKTASRQWCALGSVKSQIGHTKAAAGSAAMIKCIMALANRVLPPTIKVERPNAKLNVENSPFYLNTETRPWIHHPGETRKAGVSSFGFGGSNFHVALEEYTGAAGERLKVMNSPVHLLLFGAESVGELLGQVREEIEGLDQSSLDVRARASQLAFDPACRLRCSVVVGDSSVEARQALQRAVAEIEQSPAGFSLPGRCSMGVGQSIKQSAFLFPGQGSQYVNMGSDLANTFECYRRVWDETLEGPGAYQDLHRVVFPKPVFCDADRDRQFETLSRTDWAQPAIGVTCLGYLALAAQLGLKADCFAGHSFGELTALFAAGAITSCSDFQIIAAARGEIMARGARRKGAMTAVCAEAAEVQGLIDTRHNTVAIANRNSPRQTVVSGPVEAIDPFEQDLAERRLTFRRLPVSSAFHSSLFRESADEFASFLKDVEFAAATWPVMANATGSRYPESAGDIRSTLGNQLVQPVLFQRQVEQLYAEGVRVFIELGPSSVLGRLVKDCLPGKDVCVVSLDRKGRHGLESLWNALAELSARGLPVDYAELWKEFAPPVSVAGKLSPVAVKINGANYGKPYPPKGGANALPAPNPEVEPNHERTQESKPKQKTTHKPTMNDPSRIAAVQKIHEDALAAHSQYQKAMTDCHIAFIRTSETLTASLNGAKPIIVEDRAAPEVTAGPVPLGAPPSSPVVLPERNGHSALVAMRQSTRQATVKPIASNPPAFSEEVAVDEMPAPGPEPSPVVAEPSELDHRRLLLQIVAEKTGYPEEMLDLTLDMESGLGIDSIKRVEILAALQEKAPELNQLDAAKLATLQTLGEILDFAREQLASGGEKKKNGLTD